MRITLCCLVILGISTLSAPGQVCKPDTRYFSMEIQPCDTTSGFAFEGIVVSCTPDDESFKITKLEQRAPHQIRLPAGHASIAIRGKAGRGKIFFKYKTSHEEKESMQYLGAGEKLIVSWAPFGGMGPGFGWASHKPRNSSSFDELSVWASQKK